MLEVLRVIPLGFDGFFACLCLSLHSPKLAPRRHLQLGLAFGLADALASLLGAALAPTCSGHTLGRALPWLLGLASAGALLWSTRQSRALPSGLLLGILLFLSSIDNLLGALTDRTALSALQLVLTACASFSLALLGVESGALALRLAGRMPRARD